MSKLVWHSAVTRSCELCLSAATVKAENISGSKTGAMHTEGVLPGIYLSGVEAPPVATGSGGVSIAHWVSSPWSESRPGTHALSPAHML